MRLLRIAAYSLISILWLIGLGLALERVAGAEPIISPDVQEWAETTGLDPVDLQGAVNTTGLDPETYLIAVGHIEAPAPPPAPARPLSIPEYIQQHSAYGWLAVCVARIESGFDGQAWNPQPWGIYGEHAQGYFGWLPSTARSVGVIIGNLDSEIAGFDRMVRSGRGREFFGIGGYGFVYGTGPCLR